MSTRRLPRKTWQAWWSQGRGGSVCRRCHAAYRAGSISVPKLLASQGPGLPGRLQHRIARFRHSGEAGFSVFREIRMPVNSAKGRVSKWGTIRYALDSNARTLRLCLVMLAASIPPGLVVLLLTLIRR
jgi:hypothetical protein